MDLRLLDVMYTVPNGAGAATRSSEIVMRLNTPSGKVNQVILTTDEAYDLLNMIWKAIVDQQVEKRLKSGAPLK